MSIEQLMPEFSVRVRREVVVAAPVDRVYAAILSTDFNEALIVRTLHPQTSWLQRWHRDASSHGRPPFRLLDLRRVGFAVLAERSNESVVLGLIARLWSVRPLPQRVPAEFFGVYGKPGFVKTVVSFEVKALSHDITLLACEVRFRPTDRSSRRRFQIGWPMGWLLVRLAQREALRLISRRAIGMRMTLSTGS